MPRIRITQVKSTNGATVSQKETMRTLKLKRIRQTVEFDDSPALQGALRKVAHLVRIETI